MFVVYLLAAAVSPPRNSDSHASPLLQYKRELKHSIVHGLFPLPFDLLNSQITSKSTLDAWG